MGPTRLLSALTIALLLAGCAGGGRRAAGQHMAATSPAPSVYAGQTAATIAGLIGNCQDVKTGEVGHGGPDLASTATCTLDGRTLTVDSWTSPEAAGSVEHLLLASEVEAYFAQGEAWTVTVGDDPTLQMQLTNDAAGLIKAADEGATYPATDLPGQRSAAEAVVASIGGEVMHVPS